MLMRDRKPGLRVSSAVWGTASDLAQFVLSLLDGVARVWDWTGVYEGPPTYAIMVGDSRVIPDNQVAAAIYRDWMVIGGDMRRAMETVGRPALGE